MSGTDGSAGHADGPAAGDGPAADSARLAEEIRLLVDLVTERAEPWLRSVFAAGHGRGDPESCDVPGPGGPWAGGTGQGGTGAGQGSTQDDTPPADGSGTSTSGATASGPTESGPAESGPAGDGPTGGQGGRASACSWCPLCAVVAVVRGDTPEMAARVLDQAAALIALLRAVLADRWQPDEGVHMPGYRPSSRPGPPPAGPAPSGASVFAERPGRGSAAGGPAGAARRVQRVPVRPRERWEPGE